MGADGRSIIIESTVHPSADTSETSTATTPSAETSTVTVATIDTSKYFTYAPPKVVARANLVVYSTPGFSEASKTTKRIKKGTTVTVKDIAWSPSGYPRLKVAGGYITAARSKVKLVALSTPKKARAVLAIDATSGRVLYKKNITKAYSVASVAKLMTALMVREKVALKGYSWKSKVRVTSSALVKMSKSYTFGGGFKFKKNKTYTVDELYKLALVESNNAAAIQLGIWVSGSNTKFIRAMNTRAKELGMKHTKFVSASGLDNDDLIRFGLRVKGTAKNAKNKLSAEDVGILARYYLRLYPDVTKVTGKAKLKVRGKTVRSTNALLPGKAYYRASLKIDGLKTGTTNSAGACLVATARPTGRRRIITVILSDARRFPDTRNLIQSCYDHFVLSAQ
jgi:D-alanyl-D-alanine carboxypeptidase